MPGVGGTLKVDANDDMLHTCLAKRHKTLKACCIRINVYITFRVGSTRFNWCVSPVPDFSDAVSVRHYVCFILE